MTARLDDRAPLLAGLVGTGLVLGLLAGRDPALAVVVAAGLAFFFLVLADLTLGVCFLAVVAFLDTLPEIGSLSIAKAVGVLIVVSWVAYLSSGAEMRSLLTDRPVFTYGLIMFLAWAALTLVWAESRDAGTTALTRYLPNLLLFPIIYTAVRTRRHVIWVLAAILIGASIAAVAGILRPPGAGDLARATGTVGDANELAAALLSGLFVAGGFALGTGFDRRLRTTAGFVAVMCLTGIVLSLSRGGLVALGVATLVSVAVAGRWRGRAAIASVALLSSAAFYFALFAPLPARERVTEVGDGTGRVDLWTVGWRMVEAEPLRGVGVGNFPEASIHFLLRPGAIQRDDFIITTPKVAHNTYLQILAETGIPGALLFLGIVASALASVLLAARSFERHGDMGMGILCRGLFVGIVAYLTASFFISEMYSKVLWMLLAVGPPLLAVARNGGRIRAPG